jgi:hypothetical protein
MTNSIKVGNETKSFKAKQKIIAEKMQFKPIPINAPPLLRNKTKKSNTLNKNKSNKMSPLRISQPRMSQLRISQPRMSQPRMSPLRMSPLRMSPLRMSPLRMSPLRTSLPPNVKLYASFDELYNGSRQRLNNCTDTNTCFKETILQLYSAKIVPQYKLLFTALDRALATKEINQSTFDIKKKLLRGREKENEHVLLNIFNHHNFDSLPIPDELKNDTNKVRTELDRGKSINKTSDWVRAFEECLFYYIKSATNEFYETYDCKIGGPTIFRPKKKGNFFGNLFTRKKPQPKNNKTVKKSNVGAYKNQEWYKKAKKDYEKTTWFAQLTKADLKAIQQEQYALKKTGLIKGVRDTAVRLGILEQDINDKTRYTYVANKAIRNKKSNRSKLLLKKLGADYNKLVEEENRSLSPEIWSNTTESSDDSSSRSSRRTYR